MILTANQKNFFKDSKVRDMNGKLLTVYHGSGTKIDSFDTSYTGQGSDQYGSGFYFTTEQTFAEAYTALRNTDLSGKEVKKLGGEDNPTVVKAFINITNPIYCDGYDNPNLSDVCIPNHLVYDIVNKLPTLYHLSTNEVEPNPLSDYLENFWEVDPQLKADFKPLIKEMVDTYFQNTDLNTLDILFGKYGTILREAIRDTMGYDGVIVNFKDNQHIVAWFPEQIKDINNHNPQITSSLTDENYMDYEKLLCNDNSLEIVEEELDYESFSISM